MKHDRRSPQQHANRDRCLSGRSCNDRVPTAQIDNRRTRHANARASMLVVQNTGSSVHRWSKDLSKTEMHGQTSFPCPKKIIINNSPLDCACARACGIAWCVASAHSFCTALAVRLVSTAATSTVVVADVPVAPEAPARSRG